MVAGVGDKERIGSVEKESARAGEFGDIGGCTVAAIAKTVDAGDGKYGDDDGAARTTATVIATTAAAVVAAAVGALCVHATS